MGVVEIRDGVRHEGNLLADETVTSLVAARNAVLGTGVIGELKLTTVKSCLHAATPL
jgi:hypothetical protein